jgi:hypothetical protein
MKQEYIHAPLGQEVTGKAGNYIPCKEARLKHNDKEILYIAGISTAGNAFCCSEEFCGYIIVPGYIMSWQTKENKAGLPVSMVEPVEL